MPVIDGETKETETGYYQIKYTNDTVSTSSASANRFMVIIVLLGVVFALVVYCMLATTGVPTL